jgi:hypothetical protein
MRGNGKLSRGKWAITQVKKDLKAAMIQAKVIELAAQEVSQKIHEKKSYFDSIREHIGKLIDKIDVIELASISALTIILQPTVLGIGGFGDWIGLTEPVPFIDFSHGIQGVFWYEPEKTEMTKTKEQTAYVMSWLMSFVIAFMIVRHGAEILKVFTDIGKFASFLIFK